MNLVLTRYRTALICLGLALVTLALYWPMTHHDFINVDDPRFVIDNEHVRAGVTWSGLVWAMHTVYVETWQPVTWVSHMLDCQMYGLSAGGHHLTSLLIHIASTLLLFLWLNDLTKAAGRSAMVAALFAWHPLHVESVAWICERKDVLSTLFWLLASMAYTRYVRNGGAGRYALVLVLFALGLMSKPMAVTLPCVLLLLDFWPLNRLGLNFGAAAPAPGRLPGSRLATFAARACGLPVDAGAASLPEGTRRVLGRALVLICEKIPFFLLAAGMTAATVYAENSGGTLASLEGLPLPVRVANAIMSYTSYLTETFWPAGLAFFYPYEHNLPVISVLGAALLLAIWTGCFLLRARPQPYLIMGWLWWLGTLAPTIGLIQYCTQSKADRYMYIPSIGLFITLVWGVTELLQRRPGGRRLLPLLGGLALAACLAVTSVQLGYWQNSITLARHALDVTSNNYVAYDSLGRALYEHGQKAEAILCYQEALRIYPDAAQPEYNLGVAYMDAGRVDDAIACYAAAARILPWHYELHNQFGKALMVAGNRRVAEAIHEFEETLRLNPGFAEGQANLAIARNRMGDLTNALLHFAAAARLEPTNADYRFNLGLSLLDNHKPGEAVVQFSEEVKLTPEETKAHYRLAQALEQTGDATGAAAQYREALRRTPDFPEATAALNRILSAHPELK